MSGGTRKQFAFINYNSLQSIDNESFSSFLFSSIAQIVRLKQTIQMQFSISSRTVSQK